MFRTFAFGAVFGLLLVRAGATRYDVIARMFLLQDPHLAIVMGVAITVAAALIAALLRGPGCPALEGPGSPSPTLVPGALLFGVGWGLTGTCPGTALAQVGEGRLMGVFVMAGIFLGSAAYAYLVDRPPSTPPVPGASAC